MTPQLETKYVFTITARIGEVTSAGEIGTGVRRIIPIIGGEVKGEGINGKVCAFGADFQIIRPNELIELEAKYAFETDDGAVVYVENKGLRFGPVELLQKLKRGEPVDPKLIYFRTVPKFETGARKISLADGKPLHRLRRPPRRPRRHRRASGVVSGLLTRPLEGDAGRRAMRRWSDGLSTSRNVRVERHLTQYHIAPLRMLGVPRLLRGTVSTAP